MQEPDPPDCPSDPLRDGTRIRRCHAPPQDENYKP